MNAKKYPLRNRNNNNESEQVTPTKQRLASPARSRSVGRRSLAVKWAEDVHEASGDKDSKELRRKELRRKEQELGQRPYNEQLKSPQRAARTSNAGHTPATSHSSGKAGCTPPRYGLRNTPERRSLAGFRHIQHQALDERMGDRRMGIVAASVKQSVANLVVCPESPGKTGRGRWLRHSRADGVQLNAGEPSDVIGSQAKAASLLAKRSFWSGAIASATILIGMAFLAHQFNPGDAKLAQLQDKVTAWSNFLVNYVRSIRLPV